MIKFSALNESSSSDEEDDGPTLATREAQEEEAYSLYNKALKFRTEGKTSLSENLFKEVLQKEFLVQAKSYDDKNKGPLRPALTLKYLVYKNLASIACEKKDYHASMEAFLEAMSIDETDVSMWYRMGVVALNLPNFALARLCFEEGIKVNPGHWPCLDKVITVMYTLNDYANCLFYVSKALEKECSYLKGLVFKDQIFKEDPSLKSFCEGYFKNCDPSIHTAVYDKVEGYKFIQESLDMRVKKRSLCKSTPLPILNLKYPFKELTWKAVGESLIQMYDYVTTADPFISLACKVDLSQYLETSVKSQEVIECEKVNSPANFSSSSEACSRAASPGGVPASQSLQLHTSLLPVSTQQQIEQDQLVATTDTQVEMEVDNVATGCVVNVYTTTTPQAEVKSTDPATPHVDTPLTNGSRTPKRKRLLAELSEFGAKRRSARVRNTGTKRPQDSVNYQELLQKFLPSSLLADAKFDEQDDDNEVLLQDKNSGDHTYGQTLSYGVNDENREISRHKKLSSTEKEDVNDYITSNQNNGGMLDLLYKYVMQLASRSSFVWPKGLCDIYFGTFTRLRKHITLPNLFCHETGHKYIKEQGMAVLVFSELKVDQWYMNTGHPSSMSPSFCPKLSSTASLFQNGRDEMGQNFHADMEFLLQLTVRLDVLGSDWLEFTARVLWLRAKFHSVEGEVDLAVSCMERLTDVLQTEGESSMKTVVPNCSFTNVITLDNVQQQLESLQRCQSLEEVQRLYDHGDYLAVVELLIVTFSQPRAKSKVPGDGGIPERHAQLILLQDSLWKLENYQECVRWSEVSFNEAIQQFMNAATVAARSDWSDTMSSLLAGLDRCIKVDKDALISLEEFRLVRLTQNLIGVICLQMESYDFSSEYHSLFTVLPWILLYRIIYHEECKIKALAAKSAEQDYTKDQATSEDNSAEENDYACPSKNKSDTSVPSELNTGMPSSLMLLFTAHEYLGRRSWCCMSDGALLLLSIDVMMEELYKYTGSVQHPYHEDLSVGLEQCFYCLYGHPNKRTKAKHLQEHNAQQITLTWERAAQVYKYFKPCFLPEFDSYRTSTVSAELENLLRRVSLLVPTEEDPTNRIDAYVAYIEGGTDKCPSLLPDQPPPSFIVKDLYYLLGDYYFKSKEFSKAIRFYLLDIAVNPNRLDSWAGMALSRSSQLDQKLCSYELKKEATVYRKSAAALRCFEHALELDPTITSLWIEYGSLAYILHSHASRQLKQDGFGEDIQELLHNKKQEMLNVARQCFTAANRYEEEGSEPEELWLHHYMLGKIAEKWEKDPKIYLPHYQKALNHLHADNARYPRKIQYHNPPELSIEALEVYYRIHASCLKYLMRYEETGVVSDTLKLMHSCIKDVSSGPFANFQENQKTESQESSLSSSEAEEAPVRESVGEEKYTTDHDYYGEEKRIESLAIELHSYVKRDLDPSVDSFPGFKITEVKDVLESVISIVSENCATSSLDDSIAVSLGDRKSSEKTVDEIERECKMEHDGPVEASNIILSEIIPGSEVIEIGKTDISSAEGKEDIVQDSVVEEKAIVCEIVTELSEVQSCGLSVESKEVILAPATEQTCLKSNDVSLNATNMKRPLGENSPFIDKHLECGVSSQATDQNEVPRISLDVHKALVNSLIHESDIGAQVETDVAYVVDQIIYNVEILSEIASDESHDTLVKPKSEGQFDNEGLIKMDVDEQASPKHSLQPLQNTGDNRTEKSRDATNQKISKQSTDKKADLVLCESLQKDASPDTPSSLLKPRNTVRLEDVECSNEMLEKSKIEVEELIHGCLNAMRECLQRYIQHFKSLYRMASYYCYSTKYKNLQWAREILLAATPAVNGYPSLPGLFADRKNTNFFNGIWRVPSNEIDRAGSFGAHMYRSVLLLIEVLWKQSDYNMLLYLTQQLYRTPDFGKKYMRDGDRTSLAKESYDRCLAILRDQMNSLLQEEPPPEESRLTRCLLEIYRTCQTLLKAGIFPEETQEVLEEAYCMYKIGEVDPYPSVLDQAIKFCQLQLAKSYPPSHETGRYASSSKQPSFATDILGLEGNTSTVSTTSNCYTPDAWQREFAKSLMLSIFPTEGNVKPDLQLSGDPVMGAPVDNKQSVKVGNVDSGHLKTPQQMSSSTQVVHVEKPRAENLRACSVAFLPVAPVFPVDKSTLPANVLQKNSSTLLSCQTFECYDIFTSLMQASGYHVTSLTAPQTGSDTSIQNVTEKLPDLHNNQMAGNVQRRSWRNWSNKPQKQTVVPSLLSQNEPTPNSDMNKEESGDHRLEINLKEATEIAAATEMITNDSPEPSAT